VRITIAAIGRLKAGPDRDLFDRYRDRFDAVGRQTGLGPLTEIEIAESGRGSAPERRDEEATRLLRRIGGDATVIALDETGKALTSIRFAETIGRLRDEGTGDLAFAMGGADGHGAMVAGHSKMTLSLGAMTLPHGLARIVLAEQLYRAATILAGHPYHRE
jgi:23S rRNA (pseudouridine1915-N3)-methyltransferase